MSDPSAYPASYYAATAHPRPEAPALDGDVRADVCVVGAGFTGVSAALHLAERGYDVVVLEAARVGWGASGRNGGQIGSGQRLGVLELEASHGPERARALWDLAEEAKALVRARIERHAIDCDLADGNLLGITKPRYVDSIARETERLASRYDYPLRTMLTAEAVREAVATEDYCAGCLDAGGGHLHPLNFLLGLARAARDAGVRLFEASPATDVRCAGQAVVRTPGGAVRAKHVLLCGNAYLGSLVPEIAARVMPIGNHVLATAPLDEARAAALIPSGACVHATKFVVDYYRLSADRRLLFGGGETYHPRGPRDPKTFVRRYMLRVFPQLADVAVDYAWGGQVGITRTRMPHFGRVGSSGLFAQGFSGHGVAMAPLAGKLLAEAVAGQAERFDVFAGLRAPAFPGGAALRWPLLVAGMLYYAVRDRL